MKTRFNNKLGMLALVAIIVPGSMALAAMSSSNYKIQSDSLNFGGGAGTSASYLEQDTIGEFATGESSSTSYAMHAGYQQMNVSYISLTVNNAAALPSISGITNGSSVASSTAVVTTDDSAGYSLSIAAATSPALRGPGGAFFADYVPNGSAPDYQFTITSSQSAFGFSPEGPDIVARYKDNGSACNTGSSDTLSRCWDGFSTIPRIVAQGATSNAPTGATTTVEYQAQVGSAKIQDSGSYSATITLTAVSL